MARVKSIDRKIADTVSSIVSPKPKSRNTRRAKVERELSTREKRATKRISSIVRGLGRRARG